MQVEQTKLSEQEKSDLLNMNIQQEFNEISKNLDRYHAIFYQIWEMGYPRLSFDVPTAAILFDQKGKRLDFLFNPQFWKNSDTYTKEFVICHECLHVILNHGVRIKDLKNNKINLAIANFALDIVINHMLVDKFNFDRKSIQNEQNYCWIDTVFAQDADKVEKNRSFEYYFGLLQNKLKQDLKTKQFFIINSDGSKSEIKSDTIDIHDFLDSIDDDALRKELEEKLNESLNESDKKDFVEKMNKTGEGKEKLAKTPHSKQAGKSDGGLSFSFNFKEKVAKKKKWETVIKKWSMKYRSDFNDLEQWTKPNRRIDGLVKDLMLPSDIDDETYKNERIEVWFFCDTSGSCVQFKERFFKAANSLSPEKFKLRLFSFDTKVYDVDVKTGKVFGGGGTYFQIMEDRIQSEIKKGAKYPEAIFVLTDGLSSDNLRPQFPKKWYFFLSENFRHCLPKESNINLLRNFE